MGARTLENCSVIKSGEREGFGAPLTEPYNGVICCQGYGGNDCDEPFHKCARCKLYLGNVLKKTAEEDEE